MIKEKGQTEDVKQVERQLKGVIPRKLSEEEAGELLEWLKSTKKYFSVGGCA